MNIGITGHPDDIDLWARRIIGQGHRVVDADKCDVLVVLNYKAVMSAEMTAVVEGVRLVSKEIIFLEPANRSHPKWFQKIRKLELA